MKLNEVIYSNESLRVEGYFRRFLFFVVAYIEMQNMILLVLRILCKYCGGESENFLRREVWEILVFFYFYRGQCSC